MAGSSGMAGAWLDRLAKYNEKSLERITKARVDIEQGNYDSKRLFKDVAEWSGDTIDLWMPLAGSSNVPAAVIVVKDDQDQASMQRPLTVIPPDKGDPAATNLSDGAGRVIATKNIDVHWDNGQRGSLAFGLMDLKKAPPSIGYYTGAVFAGNELIATLHVRVISKSS
jgi:hypothetical protein